MVNLAHQRHQDLGELLIEAFQAWTPAKGTGSTGVFTMRQAEALIERKLAEDRASQETARPVLPLPQPEPQPEPQHHAAPLPRPPVGLKQCKKGHAPYPATKAECPDCARIRKREHRKNQAAKKRGEMPAL